MAILKEFLCCCEEIVCSPYKKYASQRFLLAPRNALENCHFYLLPVIVFLCVAVTAHAELMVNINTADATALEALPGIGPAKAAGIVAYRNANGAFAAKEDIKNVSGIGDATYADIEPYTTVTGTTVLDEEEEEDEETPADETSGQNDEANAASGSGEDDDDDNTSVSLALPEHELSFIVRAPKTLQVNQPAAFSATPVGISDKLLYSVNVTWNFGDTHTATGREVVHTFSYPGEYVVVVHGSYARHEDEARHTIAVLPAQLSLVISDHGEIMIENDAPYEADLSGFVLRGGETFTFPPRTLVMPRATLTVPRAQFAVNAAIPVMLVDAAGAVAAVTGEPAPAASPSVASIPMRPVAVASSGVATENFSFASEAARSIVPAASAAETEAMHETEQAEPVADGNQPAGMPESSLPYLGLIGILAVGMFAVYASKRSV